MGTIEQLRRAEIIRDYYRRALWQVALVSGKMADTLEAGSQGERALRSIEENAKVAADQDFSNL